MGEPLDQFPHPTRPILSYDAIPNPSLSVDKDSQEFQKPEALELPQTRNYPCLIPLQKYTEEHVDNLFSENVSNFSRKFGSNESSSSEERIGFSPSTGKTPKNEKEAVDELLLILIEVMNELNTKRREALLKKFYSEIEGEERLERFIVARLKQSKVKAISELCEKVEVNVKNQLADIEKKDDEDLIATKSIHESVEELCQKLERFKVRTFEAGEEVKEKENDSKK